MRTADFDYQLPEELIAQYPQPHRPASRMLVLERDTGTCEIRSFADLPEYLNAKDCLVLNDTKVIPARLLGTRIPSGGQVEALLLEELSTGRWHALMKPGRRLRPGDEVEINGSRGTSFRVAAKRPDGSFELEFASGDVLALLERFGSVPLPPYIRRAAEAGDQERYQTVYARTPGAVAAPTAGLHFTPEILAQVQARGVSVATVTLHVGPGTFKPVQAEHVEDHEMHEERFVLTPQAADQINSARAQGGRVIAIGTTSVRVLESCVGEDGRSVVPRVGRTRLFLYPPARPRSVDGLLTNFHLPRSTLLMLVCTFSSVDNVLAAYRLAVREKLRFYSYGDCMLLL
jgi:S-adenosylmethionine:tRNA ribosyltransferase-isomerase